VGMGIPLRDSASPRDASLGQNSGGIADVAGVVFHLQNAHFQGMTVSNKLRCLYSLC
jgi:hypothetical protein